MARKVQVLLVDDLDGGEADETLSFSLDGATYEIDLSSTNAKKLRDSLQPFVDHARSHLHVRVSRIVAERTLHVIARRRQFAHLHVFDGKLHVGGRRDGGRRLFKS